MACFLVLMTFSHSSCYVTFFFILLDINDELSQGFHTHTHTHAQGDPSVQPISGVYMMTSLCLIQPNKISIKLKWWSMMNTGNRFHYVVYTHMCASEVRLPKTESFSLSLPRNHSSSLPTRRGWAPVTLAWAAPLLIITAKLKARSLQLICLPAANSYHELGRSLAVPNPEHAYYGCLGTHPKPIIIKRWF